MGHLTGMSGTILQSFSRGRVRPMSLVGPKPVSLEVSKCFPVCPPKADSDLGVNETCPDLTRRSRNPRENGPAAVECASSRSNGYATATLAPSKGRLTRCTVDGLTPNRSAMPCDLRSTRARACAARMRQSRRSGRTARASPGIRWSAASPAARVRRAAIPRQCR
jgi:hypothetical protein